MITFAALLICCNKDDCEAKRKENCPITFELNPVCGCDGVTYNSPSTATCNSISDYTMGACK